MNNITITMELCPEDRQRLDNILKALTGGQAPSVEPKKAPEQANPPAQPEQPAQAVTAPQDEQDEPTVTMADIQHLVVTLAAVQDKKAEVREIVRDYARLVTEIPADKWDVVYRRLKKLEG